MKAHSPSEAKLLIWGVKVFKDAWRLDFLQDEYERLKKKQEELATAITNPRKPSNVD